MDAPLPSPAEPPQHRLRKWLLALLLVVTVQLIVIAWLAVELAQAPSSDGGSDAAAADGSSQTELTGTPEFKTETVLEGRTNIWGMAFLPSGQLLFTERQGSLNVYDTGKIRQVASISDVKAGGEGGLMGLAIDPKFTENRSLYTCFNSKAGDIRVVRWQLPDNLVGLEKRQDIITGISANPSGRHSGCRVAFGPDGYLWVGTGDSATGTQPQQPSSLNGKILRVDRDGKATPDNQGDGFDSRIYSYGHRNTQGLAFFPKAKNGVIGLSAEHGSNVDDEINPLVKGNFGWAPAQGYDETGVPMTDKKRFPDAVSAVWSSGKPTQAPSGIAIINNVKWRDWNGAVVMAVLKDKHLKILQLDAQNKVIKEEKILDNTYGRLRAVVQAPDGSLYVSTDNDSNDKIVRLTPQE